MLCSVCLGASLMFSVSNVAKAQELKATKVGDVMNDEQVKNSQEILKKNPDLIKKISDANKIYNSINSGSVLSGPAPAVSQYYVYFVADSTDGTNYTGEEVTGKSMTQYDHNGTIYVITIEVGYGREYTWFNGGLIDLYDSEILDFNNDRIVDGFWNVFKIDNVTSGTFKSRSDSYNSPRNSITTSIFIQ